MTRAIASILLRRRVQPRHRTQLLLLFSRSSSNQAEVAVSSASIGKVAASSTRSTFLDDPPFHQEPVLPVRHSRKSLPLICTDSVQLKDLTRHVLESKIPLFAYQDKKESRDDAWNEANVVVQKVEFLLRGHAHTLPGTQWNRWLPLQHKQQKLVDNDNAQETLATMQSLVERLWEDGHAYMTVRSARMEELHGPKEVDTTTPETAAKDEQLVGRKEEELKMLKAGAGVKEDEEEMDVDEGEADDVFGDDKALGEDFARFTSERGLMSDAENEETDKDEEASYLNDFALPGPTTHMYDIILDSMACYPAEPETGFSLLQDILGRHGLDGGDEQNTNEYTRPTVMSYNAPIRLAANLSYDATSSSSARLRDESLQLAFGAFDALSHSVTLRNSATYTYLLQVIAKCIPTSRTRGNIARGMLHHAREQGLIDENVLAAYQAAHTPSNGAEFDDWNSQYLANRSVKDLPHGWTRNRRVRRFHPREATY